MHLIKLVYLCHGWLLALDDRPLIFEQVEAWRYGPVVPSIYHAYKFFGGSPIDVDTSDRTGDFDDGQQQAIQFVDGTYGHLSAIQLSALTHRPGTPWDVTRRLYGIGYPIENSLIRNHFKEIADKWDLL